ncbi:MAG: hypothetical protein IVW57_18635 [Ktedonobacterales bacterium]|nr:hypothetical protein [Ktedonobacterales bacterium]
MTTMTLTLDTIEHYLMQSIHNLCNAGTLCIERHQQERVRSPRKSSASYLRSALQIARLMMRRAPHYPILWESALALLDQVCEEMDVAEHQLFRAGGTTAAYATVFAQAEGLRMQIVEAYRQELTDRAREVEGAVVEVQVASPPPSLERRHLVLRPKMPSTTMQHGLDDDDDAEGDEDDSLLTPEGCPPQARAPERGGT